MVMRWFLGGKNFEEIKKGKVGDIIFPAYNGTNGSFTSPRWDLVMKVDHKGFIISRKYLWDHASVVAIEAVQELKELGVGL